MLPQPKKRLGQNFLIDPNILAKIVSGSGVQPHDTVLEIGAGNGALTRRIASVVRKKVFACEIDRRLLPILREAVQGAPHVTVIEGDVLRLDLASLIPEGEKIKVLGNIPYNLSTPLIEFIIAGRHRISEAYLTVQKEFAGRMSASSGTKAYGSLSCFVGYYAEAEILFAIGRQCFRPVPKVDSVFIRLRMREDFVLSPLEEERLFGVIRHAFQQRRKMLTNSLKGVVPQETLERFFSRYRIDPRIRPERLSLQDFIELSIL